MDYWINLKLYSSTAEYIVTLKATTENMKKKNPHNLTFLQQQPLIVSWIVNEQYGQPGKEHEGRAGIWNIAEGMTSGHCR